MALFLLAWMVNMFFLHFRECNIVYIIAKDEKKLFCN